MSPSKKQHTHKRECLLKTHCLGDTFGSWISRQELCWGSPQRILVSVETCLQGGGTQAYMLQFGLTCYNLTWGTRSSTQNQRQASLRSTRSKLRAGSLLRTSIPRCIFGTKNDSIPPVLATPQEAQRSNHQAKFTQAQGYKTPSVSLKGKTHSIMLFELGEPFMPWGGSCCNRLKSRISLFLAGVLMISLEI